jgi:hypothetical protein
MKNALTVLFLVIPLAAAGQEPAPAAEAGRAIEKRTITRELAQVPTAWLVESMAPAAALQAPAPAPPRRSRRPSMVGYINDGAIRSQVRVRFDTGGDIDAADRAEFFYPKCGCYRELPQDHPAFDPDAPGPGPGIASSVDYQQLYVQAEYAMNDRFSVYGELPVRWVRAQAFVPGTGTFGDEAGISDLRAGAKWGMLATDTTALTLQLQGTFPTGDGRKGLGVEHFSFEPALLYNQALNERVHLEGQFGLVLPAGGSDGIGTTDSFAGKVLYYGIGPSVEVYRSDDWRVAPVVELVGWRVLDGFETSTFSEVEDMNIVNLKVGGRFDFQDRHSVYVGYGRALTDSVWYKHVLRLEYRRAF